MEVLQSGFSELSGEDEAGFEPVVVVSVDVSAGVTERHNEGTRGCSRISIRGERKSISFLSPQFDFIIRIYSGDKVKFHIGLISSRTE